MEDVDPFRHLDLAKQVHHPALFHSALDDTAVFAVEFSGLLGSDIVRWRRLIVAEITELKDELDEVTAAWLESLPPHGKIAARLTLAPMFHSCSTSACFFDYANARNLLGDVIAGFSSVWPIGTSRMLGRDRVWGSSSIRCPGPISSVRTSSMSKTLSARGDPTPISTLCCKASSTNATKVRFLGLMLHRSQCAPSSASAQVC